ncbi:hypothetical protein SCOCK_70248 [Actinacidiphila cocklensis]|uniref:Uncharacterized protein n=1 Tax=Actinacidiphila cocklensis TaxID=887465 RepID=A0A9W4GUU9_9ACTN|nr:hypothetical protein SCOCK_70248 [Actinacidiphila cocklensis]
MELVLGLHRRHDRLLQQPQLVGEVVDAGRDARRRRRLGRPGHVHRRLRRHRRYDRRLGRLQLPGVGRGPRVRHRRHRAVHQRPRLHRHPRQPGLRPDDQHLVLEPVHLLGHRWHHGRQHPAAHRRIRGQRGAVQPDVPEPELLLHLQRPDRGAQRVPGLRQHRQRHGEEAGGRRLPRQRQPRNRRAGLHRGAEHRQLLPLLRHEPVLRLPRGTVGVLRPRPDPAQLELQLQGGRRLVGHRPAGQPQPRADRLGHRLEDRPVVLEHPVGTRHDDPAQRHGQRRRFRRDHPQHQRQHRVQRRQPRPGAVPRQRLHELHVHPGRADRRQPLLLTARRLDGLTA